MAAESRGYVQVLVVRMTSNDAVSIEAIVIVVARPTALHLNGLKGRHTTGQGGPNVCLEISMIHVQCFTVWLLVIGGTAPAQEIAAKPVATEVSAVGIDCQRCSKSGAVSALCIDHVDITLAR